MKATCYPTRLDRLLAGELSGAQALELRAHLRECGACAHELAWQRQERGLLAQRARGARAAAAARPGLRWEALEQRLRQVPARARARWERRGTMAAGALAAMLVAAFSLVLGAEPLPESSWGGELVSRAPGPEAACIEPGPDAVARHEARFEACLLASPLVSLR
ncbi:zf-HC2 domain-containing protein [Aggregicoccus sp. 17bor-14]|uniref:zf-HC2 domain-containing protein n=1 Tax=Myxococcaceae TaxID=31 RepID=UPI00129C1AFD|nr:MULTISPECIES: zf-HC2 domain-containing protein [Myxococcaceae]MBF5045355.1 zf-HC2 domain-containing protein [Simulacricoccus sp. 17bor-14]MRI91097.1 zf-HC2 domain-containing protein [Aggregicoccus sp. 17bor-14]